MAAGCAGGPAYTPKTYVVKPRDTLYSIAWRHDLDYRDLARWNHVGADYRITVGEVLMLEPNGYRGAQAGASHAAARVTPLKGASRESAPQVGSGSSASAASAGSSPPEASRAIRPEPNPTRPGQPCGVGTESWLWPTAHASAPRVVPGGGVLLLGVVGQPIRAACPGRVVYAGNGIRGYGNLIIIKHGESLLSAYAHTIELSVHEGESVTGGEEIARMGTGSHDIAALYFEIRVNGKPVDPLQFLPGE